MCWHSSIELPHCRGFRCVATRWVHYFGLGIKQRPQSPNYFIAVPVSNPIIHEAASLAHKHILDVNCKFQPAMVSIAKLHVTLLVLRLNSEEELTRLGRTVAGRLTDTDKPTLHTYSVGHELLRLHKLIDGTQRAGTGRPTQRTLCWLRQTDRQTDVTDRWTGEQTDRQTDKQTGIEMHTY